MVRIWKWGSIGKKRVRGLFNKTDHAFPVNIAEGEMQNIHPVLWQDLKTQHVLRFKKKKKGTNIFYVWLPTCQKKCSIFFLTRFMLVSMVSIYMAQDLQGTYPVLEQLLKAKWLPTKMTLNIYAEISESPLFSKNSLQKIQFRIQNYVDWILPQKSWLTFTYS